jgi:hypothetical protein
MMGGWWPVVEGRGNVLLQDPSSQGSTMPMYGHSSIILLDISLSLYLSSDFLAIPTILYALHDRKFVLTPGLACVLSTPWSLIPSSLSESIISCLAVMMPWLGNRIKTLLKLTFCASLHPVTHLDDDIPLPPEYVQWRATAQESSPVFPAGPRFSIMPFLCFPGLLFHISTMLVLRFPRFPQISPEFSIKAKS